MLTGSDFESTNEESQPCIQRRQPLGDGFQNFKLAETYHKNTFGANRKDRKLQYDHRKDALKSATNTVTPKPDLKVVGGSEAELELLNDAEVLGDKTLPLESFLQQEFTFMTGDLYPQDNRRSAKDGDWKAVEMPLINWINGDGKTWGLSVHPVGKSKDGASLVPSFNLDGARKDSAVKTMHAIGIDIDSGTSLDDVIDRLEAANIFATVYTTFNHRTTKMVLKHDEVMRKLKIQSSPDLAQIKAYLSEHHDTQFDQTFIDAVEVVEARTQTKDGMRIILKVPPIDKFRVIIPLAAPVELADLAPTLAQWKEVWADAVTGLCKHILKCEFDATSTDVNRLFYSPRHAKGAEWYSAVVMGKPLKFEDIKPYSKAKFLAERKAKDNPFTAGAGDGRQDVGLFETPLGVSLSDWHKNYNSRFMLSDVLETYCAEKDRAAGGERAGTMHVECPFEAQHSSSGGTATLAMNPDVTDKGYWTIFCQHDSCKGRHKLEFVQEMLEQQWFDEALLTDEAFLLPSEDDGGDQPAEKVSLSGDDLAASFEKFNKDTSDEEVKTCLKALLAQDADTSTLNRAKEAITERTALGKRDYDRMLKTLRAEAVRESANTKDLTPVVNMWDFKRMAVWGEEQLLAARDNGQPIVFNFENDVALIQSGRRQMPTKDQFAAVLNDVSKWNHQTSMGDQVRTRGVSAPDDVVKQLFNARSKDYPELQGVAQAPFFASDGRLVIEDGYDAETQTYLDLGDLDVPRVSAVPTDDEVYDAKCLLLEDAMGDFPFDAVKDREERLQRCLDNTGEPLPSAAHAVCMTLEQFMRDMIDGVTPCYTIAKNKAGTGGGFLADIPSIIATGYGASAQNMPQTDEEFVKVMTAIVQDGAKFCFFDNMNTAATSGVFASALTAPKLKARLLGTSNMVDAPIRHTWIAVANDFKATPEIVRRLIMIELNAKVADPTKRKFVHADIKAWAHDNRGDLVWACLTLIQNWVAKGMKPWAGTPRASFEQWSWVMGGILRDAGIRGFLENSEYMKTYATVGEDVGEELLVEHLASNYGDGTLLKAGGTAKIAEHDDKDVVSVQDVLNVAGERDGGNGSVAKPLILQGWGYTKLADGENEYTHARGISQSFKELARDTFNVFVDGKDCEVSFEQRSEKKSKKSIYWIMTVTDTATGGELMKTP